MKLFKNLYDYRELLKTNVKKDIRGKYKGSFLGVLWSFLNPLLMVAVYAIVFPYIMRIKQAIKKLTSPLNVADIGKISLGKYTFLITPALFLILPIPSPITVVKKFHGITPQIKY